MRRTDSESYTKRYFRAQERVFAMNGQWYFTAREGDVGPFRTRERALDEVARYARERQDLERFQNSRRSRSGPHTGSTLAILPKAEEEHLTHDDLMVLENQR
jgi:hypothetical protein